MHRPWTAVFGAALIAFAARPARATELQSMLSGLCLQPEGGLGAWNGSVIRQVPCDPHDDSYVWVRTFAKDEGGRRWWYLENRAHRDSGPTFCLDLTDGNTADWTPLQLWECTSSTTMWWTFDNNRLINYRSRKCMDVRGGSSAPGTVIQNYHCANLPDGPNLAQIWDYPH